MFSEQGFKISFPARSHWTRKATSSGVAFLPSGPAKTRTAGRRTTARTRRRTLRTFSSIGRLLAGRGTFTPHGPVLQSRQDPSKPVCARGSKEGAVWCSL